MDINLNNLPRLRELREEHFNTKAEICTELPAHITEFWKANESDRGSMDPVLWAGKLMNYVLSNKQPLFPDDSLLAGTTSSKKKGVLVYPDLMGLSIWPELETVSKRKANPYGITEDEIKSLNYDIFPYWMDKTVQELTRRKFNSPKCQQLMERIVFFLASKNYCISHTFPDYQKVVTDGLDKIIDEAKTRAAALGSDDGDGSRRAFYEGTVEALTGVKTYAANLSREAARLATLEKNEIRRKELETISEICAKVPAGKSETLHEALNAIWICKIALHQENVNAALSLGRLDRILYPLYKADIDAGRLDELKAAELLGCFWLKVPDHLPLSPQTGEELFGGAGSVMSITLGGIDENGKDAVNDLTLLMLKVSELLALKDPNVNVRYHPKENSKDFLRHVCHVNYITKGTPCFHNDVAAIDGLMNLGMGIKQEHANDYSLVGCVEPVAGGGRSYPMSGALLINLVSALEMSLFSGRHRLTGNEQIGDETKAPDKISSFDEFFDQFETHARFLIDQATELNNMMGTVHRDAHPVPLLSSLSTGPMDKGMDLVHGGAVYNSSGMTFIGLSEVVDSLLAVERFVFDADNPNRVGFAEMMEAIEGDWPEKYKTLHARVKNSDDKYGKASPAAAAMTERVMKLLSGHAATKRNYREGPYTVGYWSMTNHAGFGFLMGAMPSGRKAKENLPSGITPVSGSAPELADALNFMSGMDTSLVTNGQALNLKLVPPPPGAGQAEEDAFLDFFRDTVHTYLSDGGLQIQFNIISEDELLDAYNNPEKHSELLVRVSGYSAYFKDLNQHMKQEIVDRALYARDGHQVND